MVEWIVCRCDSKALGVTMRFFLIFFPLIAFALPHPYDFIEVLPQWPFGYYTNRLMIDELFQRQDIRTVIEVGSWAGGGSTRHLGEQLQTKNGVLYAVDTWLGSSTQQPGQVHFMPVLDHIYQQFLSNMIAWNLADTVIPVRMRSVEAARALKIKADLIYIDGEHTAEAVYEDLVAWLPHLNQGGIFCGDDWGWESVREGLEKFAKERNFQIVPNENFWELIVIP